MITFNPAVWYWVVAGSTTQVFSSAVGDYVLVSDVAYQAWLAAGNRPSKINSEADLAGVLAANSLRPVNPNVLAAYQAAKANAVDQVQFRILFNHENRIRALAGQQQITAQQFIAAIASLM